MQVTVLLGEDVAVLEVGEDIELENFYALVRLELPSLEALSHEQLAFMTNARQIHLNDDTMKQTLKQLGIKHQDALYVMGAAQTASGADTTQPRASQPSAAAGASRPRSGSTTGNPDMRNLISTLVSQIQVPSRGANTLGAAAAGASNEEANRHESRRSYEAVRAEPSLARSLRLQWPKVAQAYEDRPDDYEHFHHVFTEAKREMSRRAALVHDETSIEGQQFIADRIRVQAIQQQYDYAMEHLPEAFIPINLLHVHIRINDVEVLAMIDSGAQTSILSAAIAKKCNVLDYVDERFHTQARGVGGSSKVRGRIHACNVRVGTAHTNCSFDVLDENRVEVLLGLNFLRPNGCVIDCKRNVLVMHDTETHFLGEAEYRREVQRLGHIAIDEVEVSAPSTSAAPAGGASAAGPRAITATAGTTPSAAAAASSTTVQHASAPSASSSTPAATEVDSEKFAQLLSMGLDGEKAAAALRRFNNDFHQALQFLLNELDEPGVGPSSSR